MVRHDCAATDVEVKGAKGGWGVSRVLQRYMAEVHAPLLLKPAAQAMVLAVFLGIFLLCCAALPRISKYVSSFYVTLPSSICKPRLTGGGINTEHCAHS